MPPKGLAAHSVPAVLDRSGPGPQSRASAAASHWGVLAACEGGQRPHALRAAEKEGRRRKVDVHSVPGARVRRVCVRCVRVVVMQAKRRRSTARECVLHRREEGKRKGGVGPTDENHLVGASGPTTGAHPLRARLSSPGFHKRTSSEKEDHVDVSRKADRASIS